MKTTFKRATALLLSLLMVFSVCSTALVVYAATGAKELSLGSSSSWETGDEFCYTAPSKGMLYITVTHLEFKKTGGSWQKYQIANFASEGFKLTVNGEVVDGVATSVLVEADETVEFSIVKPDGYAAKVKFKLSFDANVVNYVSIGDSMANGYGFTGYNQTSDDRNVYDFIAGTGMYGDGAYPLQFEAYLEELGYVVNHTKLAPSALLAEDLLYLLDGREEFDDGWNGYKDYIGTYTDAELKAHFQNAITDADVITMGIGNASFGAFMLDHVTSAFGVFGSSLGENEKLTLEDALLLVEDEELKQNLLNYYNELFEDLQAMIPAEIVDEYNLVDACNIVVYTAASYIVNYKLVLEKILEMNPDVEIVLVGLLNTTYGMNITDDNGNVVFAFGDTMDTLFDMLNAYMAGLPAVLQAAGEYEDATIFYAEQPEPKFICQEFKNLMENGWDNIDGLDGAIVRQRNIDAFNENKGLGEMIGNAINGAPLAKISLEDVQAYELLNWEKLAEEAGEYWNPWGAFVFSGRYADATVASDKILAVAIYLAIEEAVANSTTTMDIQLSGLLKIAGDLSTVFTDLGTPPTASPEASRQWLLAGLSTDKIQGMCKIYGLFKVGNGMSVHPTPAGHDDIAESVIGAYEGKYTVQQATIDNAKKVLDLLAEYYDEAYAYAYAYAESEGYIDEAVKAIDAAIAEVKALDKAITAPITAEFQALARAELGQAIATLEAAKALIIEADVLDQASLDALLALLGEAAETVIGVEALLAQAGVDVNQLAIIPALKAAHAKLVNEIIPAIDAQLQKAVIEGTKKFIELAKTTLGDLADAAVKAAIKFAPELDAMLYDYFYNNPEEVIAFFTEYGYIIADLAEKYGDEALGVAAYVLVVYGEDMAVYFMENYETIFEGIVAWADKYGERTAEMLQVYAEALGLCDAVRGEIAILEEKLAQLEAQLEAQLKLLDEQLKVQLEALYAQLETAVGPHKQAILEQIAQIEAQIELVKQYIAQLQAMIETVIAQIDALNAKLQTLIEALYNLDDALKALVEAGIAGGIDAVNAALDNLAVAVVDLIGVISKDIAAQVNALIEQAKDILAEVYYNATHADYEIDKNSAYVALGDKSYNAEAFAQYIAEIVKGAQVGYDYKTTDLTEADSTIADLTAIIEANLAEIATADLISLGYGFDHVAENTLYILLDLALEGQTAFATEFDWISLVGVEATAEIEKILAKVYNAMVEQGLDQTLASDVTIADAAMAAIEYFAYQVVEYAVALPQVVYAINEINPEALIMVNAISNPLAGASIDFFGEEFVIGDYLTYITDAIFVETAAIAILSENVVFVPANGATTNYTDSVILSVDGASIYSLIKAYIAREFAIEITEDGALYVADAMFAALNVTVKTGALLGDVNGDGKVNVADAIRILQYDSKLYSDIDVTVADVNGDGKINVADAIFVLQYDSKLISKFPAEK